MKRYTKEEKDWLIENYGLMGSHYCAKYLNRPLSSIRQTANTLGCKVSIKKRNELHSKTLITKFESGVKSEIFKKIEKSEAAYVLGLLWADGWITNKNSYSVNIKLISEDFNEIKWIFYKLGKWKEYNYNPKQRKATTQLRVSGKEITDYLVSLGYSEKEKSAQKVIETIPINLRHYWWRGFFDGDGYLSVSKCKRMGFSGPINQDWSFVPKNFKITKYIHPIKGHKSSKAMLYNKEDILNFANYIYNNAKNDRIYLPRKYKKFQMLCQENYAPKIALKIVGRMAFPFNINQGAT